MTPKRTILVHSTEIRRKHYLLGIAEISWSLTMYHGHIHGRKLQEPPSFLLAAVSGGSVKEVDSVVLKR